MILIQSINEISIIALLLRFCNRIPFAERCIPGVDISRDTEMPTDAGNHEGESEDDCCPQHGTPLVKVPSLVSQRPYC
jgi:hypothetical protein